MTTCDIDPLKKTHTAQLVILGVLVAAFIGLFILSVTVAKLRWLWIIMALCTLPGIAMMYLAQRMTGDSIAWMNKEISSGKCTVTAAPKTN